MSLTSKASTWRFICCFSRVVTHMK
jgi:hypothetical protein